MPISPFSNSRRDTPVAACQTKIKSVGESSIRLAAMVILATAVLAKVVGFMREAVIAATYGTSHVVDIYLAGITLPAMAVTIVFHFIPNAFIPFFSETNSDEQTHRQAWGVLGLACLISAGMWWLAGPLASLTNSGFPETLQSETVAVLRITAGAIALATVEALLRSRLLGRRRFVRPGLSLLLQSAMMIIAVWLYPNGGPRTLAWGFLAGTAAAALCNLSTAGLLRKRAQHVSEAAASSLRDNFGLWVPMVLLIDTIHQLHTVIDRHLGAGLAEGSIAALQYADLIATMPISICGLALGTAVFPFLSQALQLQDPHRASEILDTCIGLSLIMTVPVMVWLMLFGQEITGLLYERGAFDQESRLLTGSTLMAYAPGIIPNALMIIIPKVFYSSRRWVPVLLSSALSVAAKGLISFWLVGQHGIFGLAAASAIASSVGAMFLLLALPSAFTTGFWRRWAQTALVLSFICIACALAAIALASLLPIQSQSVLAIVKLACAIVFTGAIVYSIANHVGLREVDILKESVNRLILRPFDQNR
jgi:putative peptidoglycan lipid II flippase